MSNRSFWGSLQKSEWAIAHFLLFSKEQPKDWLLFCSFKKSSKKSDRSFILSKRATKRASEQKWAKNERFSKSLIFRSKKLALAHFQNGAIAYLLIIHFRSFQKSNWAITGSFALLKKANERSLFSALFAKERMSDRSFFALFKRVTKRAIALLLFLKEWQKEWSLFCSFKKSDKKERLLFQKEQKGKNERKMSNFPNR